MLSDIAIETINWNKQGLVPAIIQDANSLQVLMMAFMNVESLKKTLELGETVFWSRSRQNFWHKGETSGHTQIVKEIRLDCDADTLLILVEPVGPACHTNATTCFFRTLDEFIEKPERL